MAASCDYWRASRPMPKDEKQVEGNSADREMAGRVAPSCSVEHWGVPVGESMESVTAHAVIAIVPDPVHSHLASEFDRAVDDLMAAASDNGYLMSYSWLPWKAPDHGEAKETKAHDQEPGLLVFDQRSKLDKSLPVLYMFLVAEMPADGVNAEQLQKALRYELQLRSPLGNAFATDANKRLRIIGPQYSGSATSLRQSIRSVLLDSSINPETGRLCDVAIAGTTSTRTAQDILNQTSPFATSPCTNPKPLNISYESFASGEQLLALRNMLRSNYRNGEFVVLQEDGTFYGTQNGKDEMDGQSIPFPREISVLRNSYKDGNSASAAAEDAPPTTTLRLSTHDEGAQDRLPDFSTDVTPVSQESQMMSIARMLTQKHARFAYITASNPLDTVFLAKSLHRTNPDTRLVLEPDLLLQRQGDDAAFIGSLSVTPYPLVWPARSRQQPTTLRPFASAETQAYYNAASYTLGDMAQHPHTLYGYDSPFPDKRGDGQIGATTPPLWLTAVGSDGYYPVALLPTSAALPAVAQAEATNAGTSSIYPSYAWQALCVLVALVCLVNIVTLLSASYASPQTCDLDIQQNSMPHRRALYVQLGGAVLFLMSALVSLPVANYLFDATGFEVNPENAELALGTLLLGALGWGLAIAKTRKAEPLGSGAALSLFQMSEPRLCALLYGGGIVITLLLTGMWLVLCVRSAGGQKLGVFFSYRCMHPLSGVSPLAPALLLSGAWFFWAALHARRLRLTMASRPSLPDAESIATTFHLSSESNCFRLFVSDHRLRLGLLEDTTCLMISRRLLHQILRLDSSKPRTSKTRHRAMLLDSRLMLLLIGLAVAWILFCPIHALDHFGTNIGFTTLYELFLGLLLVPLLVITLCAAARLFLISSSLREQLLEPLERMPLRQAFTRLKGFNWVVMLRESGQLERWRDMARSAEGIRQILNHPQFREHCCRKRLQEENDDLENEAASLRKLLNELRQDTPQTKSAKRACELLWLVEMAYATCAETILACILVPYWTQKSHSLLQSTSKKDVADAPDERSQLVQLAEEFLAIRYVAFIRAILAQMRYLMLFISGALVLVILAIHSYPFQPNEELNWCITGSFLCFSVGMVFVLAQMHRNSLLGRITNKTSHGLGLDFYLRAAAFGALPLITWVATQYPTIGGTLYGLLKPGLEAFK